jgi:hypothetical protein
MDEYSCTKSAFEAFYANVEINGIVTIDDYGSHPFGAVRSTDEFIATLTPIPFLHRIDHGARLFMKIN